VSPLGSGYESQLIRSFASSPSWRLVQAEECVLHHVLGGLLVAEHDHREPQQAEGVRLV
jgi:hypothetical protein